MDEIEKVLIIAANSVLGEFKLAKEFSVGSCGAAIQTSTGNIYTGVCIDLGCGLGFCAEAAAIAEMLKHRKTHITRLVAVTKNGVLPPCGRCREMMVQVDRRNIDCSVMVSENKSMTLRQLLPSHWLVKAD
jgi:cytidine deaminase